MTSSGTASNVEPAHVYVTTTYRRREVLSDRMIEAWYLVKVKGLPRTEAAQYMNITTITVGQYIASMSNIIQAVNGCPSREEYFTS